MKELTQEIKVANFAKYKRYLVKLIGEEQTTQLINLLGGQEDVMNASFGMTTDSGSAYDGALVENILKIGDYAIKINDILPEEMRVSNQTLYKVILLQHISKVLMYSKNENKWEVDNRGLVYKFRNDSNRPNTLRCGEYSILILLNANIKLEAEEYEAICLLDKINSGEDNIKWYASTLSTIIRQANEIVSLINKKTTNIN